MSKISNIGYVPYQRSGNQPKQGIDIFRKRMEEAFSSPEQLKNEIQGSGMQHIKKALVTISIIFNVLLLVFALIYTTKKLASAPVFCSPNNTENCWPCPEFGVCDDGSLKCIKNYVRKGYECVEDKVIIQKAYDLLYKTEDYIVTKSTSQFLMNRSKFYSSIEELKLLFRDSESVDELFVDLLLNNKSNKLIMDYINSEPVFYAKEPYLNVFALIQIFMQDNFTYLLAGFIILILLIFKIVQLKKQRDLNLKASQMYELVRNQLKENIDDTPEHGVPEETLKEAIVRHLGKDSAGILWPLIENLRKNDKQVSKFEIPIGGRPQILWQWKDIRNLKSQSNR